MRTKRQDNDIDLNLLRVFEAIVSTGSVTSAARRLGLTQAATSNALRRLREQVGDPLFVRSGGKLLRTPMASARGAEVIDAYRLALRVLGPGVVDIASVQTTLRISTSDHVDSVLLESFGRELLETAPGVAIVIEPFSPRASERALAGELDWVIAPRARLADDLRSRALLVEPYVLVARATHPARRRFHTLATYTALSHVVVAPAGGVTPTATDKALAERGLERRIRRTVPTFAQALLIVSESDLVTTLPRSLAARFASVLGLVVTKPPVRIPNLRVELAWPKRLHEDPVNRWLRARLVEHARTIAAGP